MRRYADPYVCPDCRAALPAGVVRCPRCGLHLQGELAGELLQTLQRADELLARMRADSAVRPAATAAPPFPSATPAPAAPPADVHRGFTGLSVPKILLGLGALCLLVAAVIFLAVAWSWLGVGGRTAVLVGLTLLSGGLGTWLGRRGLRVAAESLTTVALGLLALDVVGADNAGWLGDLDDDALVCVVGGVVLAAALALALTTRLGAAQVGAALALTTVGVGALGVFEHRQLVATLLVLAYAGLAVVATRAHLALLGVLAGIAGGWWWFGLIASGFDEAGDHPSLHALWADGHGLALLTASLLVLLPAAFLRGNAAGVRGLVAVTAALLTVTAALPVADESATAVGVVAVVGLVLWTAASQVAPTDWRVVCRVPMGLTALPVIGVGVALAMQALANSVSAADPFTVGAGARLPDPDPVAAPVLLVVCVAGLLAAVGSVLPRPVSTTWLIGAGAALALAAIGTVALYPVPVWTVVAALAVLGTAGVADAVRRDGALGLPEAVTALVVLGAAEVVALPSAVLATAAAALLVASAGALLGPARFEDADAVGGFLLPAAAGWLLWCALEVAEAEDAHRGVPVLVLVGLIALALPRPGIELTAVATGTAAAVVAVEAAHSTSGPLAVHLTVAGVLVSGSALAHPSRRLLGWPGGALLAAASWVRLADVGVEAPEAYTLPSAVALLLVGLDRLRRDRNASSLAHLTPGLTLATVPSLLWVLVDPVSLRAALLGLACVVLVLGGVLLRWNAPLTVGAGVGLVAVLRELAPYAAEVPQWVLIGFAGTVLTLVGITWEKRMRDARYAAAYLARLR